MALIEKVPSVWAELGIVYVLTDQKRIIARHSVQAMTVQELATPDIQERLKSFDIDIQAKTDDIVHDYSNFPADNVLHIDSDAGLRQIDGESYPFDPHVNDNAVLDHDNLLLAIEIPNINDKMIGAGAFLPRGGEMAEAVVIKRARDSTTHLYIFCINTETVLSWVIHHAHSVESELI